MPAKVPTTKILEASSVNYLQEELNEFLNSNYNAGHSLIDIKYNTITFKNENSNYHDFKYSAMVIYK